MKSWRGILLWRIPSALFVLVASCSSPTTEEDHPFADTEIPTQSAPIYNPNISGRPLPNGWTVATAPSDARYQWMAGWDSASTYLPGNAVWWPVFCTEPTVFLCTNSSGCTDYPAYRSSYDYWSIQTGSGWSALRGITADMVHPTGVAVFSSTWDSVGWGTLFAYDMGCGIRLSLCMHTQCANPVGAEHPEVLGWAPFVFSDNDTLDLSTVLGADVSVNSHIMSLVSQEFAADTTNDDYTLLIPSGNWTFSGNLHFPARRFHSGKTIFIRGNGRTSSRLNLVDGTLLLEENTVISGLTLRGGADTLIHSTAFELSVEDSRVEGPGALIVAERDGMNTSTKIFRSDLQGGNPEMILATLHSEWVSVDTVEVVAATSPAGTAFDISGPSDWGAASSTAEFISTQIDPAFATGIQWDNRPFLVFTRSEIGIIANTPARTMSLECMYSKIQFKDTIPDNVSCRQCYSDSRPLEETCR